MLEALSTPELGEDLLLLVVQFRRNDPRDRLADHLLWRVAEDAGRPGVPRGDPPLQGLADDRIVGRGDNRRQARRVDLRLRALGHIDQQVDRADHLARGIAQRGRMGQKGHARAIRPLGDGLDPPQRPALPQRPRHRAFVIWHWPTIGPIEAPGSAPSRDAELWPISPERGSGLVIEGDAAVWIGRVNGDGQGLKQISAGDHGAF